MRFRFGTILLICFALVAQSAANASSIVLSVKDQTGAGIPNAHVQIVPSPSNIQDKLTTDSHGELSLDVSPGSYEVTVESLGFAKAARRVKVKGDTPQTINIVLKVWLCSQCPIVTNVFAVPFPAKSLAVSPDGRYAIIGVDTDREPYHTVFLEDRVLNTRRKLFNYDRNIVLLWKPDSKLFAVTDYTGSDSSQCRIISADEDAPPIQVLDILSRQLSEDA
ncbi:MAG TPA: carboxypeptidase-like regulatory domain-containing protein [Methylomirabilota bacterium]|nr:carboxypeptidase-like regulatory domain-containing protein [Methylomirabilota bacterium]